MCERRKIMQNSNVDWITTKELAEIKGISERAVRKSIAKNKYVIRKSWAIFMFGIILSNTKFV